MEIILREDVAGLGIIGDVVKVKPGFARNFLLPRGLAVVADRRNLGQLEHHKRIIAAKKARERGDIEGRAKQIGGVVVETEVRAGKGGRLFGSVTNLDVKKLLDEKGFDIDRRRIELKDPIKEIGEFDVLVRRSCRLPRPGLSGPATGGRDRGGPKRALQQWRSLSPASARTCS